ncbi:MAG: DUF427 domain-containing protein [Flavobacteriales bacterium]|jgi:uncharacterized protein (DUF427 family)|nr:DUF427 domain-containing protein [Flavobacteriales bacterium]
MQAIWNNTVIAESNQTINIEGNQYFPADAIKQEFFIKSDLHSTCHWKGEASYYHIVVDGKTNENAAWYYPKTSQLAKSIEGYVAFWRGVEVQ